MFHLVLIVQRPNCALESEHRDLRASADQTPGHRYCIPPPSANSAASGGATSPRCRPAARDCPPVASPAILAPLAATPQSHPAPPIHLPAAGGAGRDRPRPSAGDPGRV